MTRYATVARTKYGHRSDQLASYQLPPHGLRRYDSVDPLTNAPKARRNGKTSRAGRDDTGATIVRILWSIGTNANVHTTLNSPALVRPRRSTDHILRRQHHYRYGYSSTDADHAPARTIYNQLPAGPRHGAHVISVSCLCEVSPTIRSMKRVYNYWFLIKMHINKE